MLYQIVLFNQLVQDQVLYSPQGLYTGRGILILLIICWFWMRKLGKEAYSVKLMAHKAVSAIILSILACAILGRIKQ